MSLLLPTLLVVLVGVTPGPTNAEVFTSTHDLKQVFLMERNLVDALGKYLVKEETRLGRIRR